MDLLKKIEERLEQVETGLLNVIDRLNQCDLKMNIDFDDCLIIGEDDSEDDDSEDDDSEVEKYE